MRKKMWLLFICKVSASILIELYFLNYKITTIIIL